MSLPSQRRGNLIALLIGIVVAAIVLYETLTVQTDAIESGEVTEVGGPFIEPGHGLLLVGLLVAVAACGAVVSWIGARIPPSEDDSL